MQFSLFTFRLTRWAAATSALLMLIAMRAYPGGTWNDHTRSRYSFLANSLSDLGALRAWNGQSNVVGARLFAAALGIVAIGGAFGCVVLTRLYAVSPATRRLARFAVPLGALACFALVGAATIPEDTHPLWHGRVSLIAALALAGVLVCVAVASMLAPAVPRYVGVWWATLLVLLCTWLIVIGRQPRIDGMVVAAIGLQKVLAVALVLTMVVQARAGERLIRTAPPGV